MRRLSKLAVVFVVLIATLASLFVNVSTPHMAVAATQCNGVKVLFDNAHA